MPNAVPPELQIPTVAEASVRVDGRADEPVWAQALRIRDFETFAPVPERAPLGPTEVSIFSTSKALFLHFKARDPQPSQIRASFGRRETRFADDWIGFYLDTSAEAQRAYLFVVTPLGIQADGTRISGADGDDTSWDGRWDSAGRITEDGYEVEVAIPWSTIRHPRQCDRLGLFLFRHIARLGEKSSWPHVDPNKSGMLMQEGILGGPGELGEPEQLLLIPDATYGMSQDGPASDRWGVEGLSAGLTARYNPSPALSLLATANPDFSQVESDSSQIDVNRRYPLQFEEKRPFFLEGQEWFQHPFARLVYTRSMVNPRYGLRATAEKSGWTTSVLHALDAAPPPSVSEQGGWTSAELDQHMASETVLRVRRSLSQDGYVGGILSDRSVLGSDMASRLAGLDGMIRRSDHLTFDATGLVSGTSYLNRESGAGTAWRTTGTWSGRHLWLMGKLYLIDPEFRAENGMITTADAVGSEAYGNWTFYTPWKAMPSIDLMLLNNSAAWTTAQELRNLWWNPSLSFRWGNGASTGLSLKGSGELYAGAWLPTRTVELWADVSATSWLSFWMDTTMGESPFYADPYNPRSGWMDQYHGGVTLQPHKRLATTFWATWEDFSEIDGTPLYDGWVGRAKVEVSATRNLWVRLIADTSTFAETRTYESLFAWEGSPGKAIYLGGSVMTGDEPTWQLFTKASWVFGV